MFAQILHVVQYYRDNDIVHRDLKAVQQHFDQLQEEHQAVGFWPGY